MPEAIQAAQSDAAVTVTQVVVPTWEAPNNAYYTFVPATGSPTTGFIIYPGASIEPLAYAPQARALAEQGYLVAIVSMPNYLAITGSKRGAEVLAAFPAIQHWAVGGHSVGGVAASGYARSEAKMEGVVLWASYPSFLFSLAKEPVLVSSISGTLDNLSKPSTIDASASDLPLDTTWVKIEGGNHTQFGWYGDGVELQPGDNAATITREEQTSQIVAATAQLLASLVPPTTSSIQQTWCVEMQQYLEGYDDTTLNSSLINNTIHYPVNAFIDSKPSVTSTQLNVHTWLNRTGTTSMGYEQIWCKSKTAQAIDAKHLGGGSNGTTLPCSAMNEAAINWALSQVTPLEQASYLSQGIVINYLPDVIAERGDQWVASNLLFEEVDSTTYNLQGTNLRTSTSIPFVGGMNYCKLLSPEGALQFVQDIAAP